MSKPCLTEMLKSIIFTIDFNENGWTCFGHLELTMPEAATPAVMAAKAAAVLYFESLCQCPQNNSWHCDFSEGKVH